MTAEGFHFMVCEQGAMVGDDFHHDLESATAAAVATYNAAVAAGDDAPLVTLVLIGPEEWAREYATA